ncbi:MAG: peptidase [Rhizobacter sp.]|nr:peptidase [Rhizobacter sp.]
MFASVKARFQDTKTIALLCTQAEQSARAEGRVKPGSEHFVLAALQLPDDTARHAFRSLGIDANAFNKAIATQFADALAAVGVVVEPSAAAGNTSSTHVAPASTPYEAEPSGQALMQRIAASRNSRPTRCLMSADVLLASAQQEHSIASRAFASLGVSKQQLADAANQAIAGCRL